MALIDIQKASKEVIDKYSLVSNAFRLTETKSSELDKNNKPKDLVTIEVGDTKQIEFYPQIKLCRWGDSENDNEVNFSIRLKDEDTINTAIVSTDKDKIVWGKGNIFIENYAFDADNYKFVWYLKSKPITNKVEFTIQSKGLDFFYQPELTPEEIADGAFRPENVIGSYAVYHSTKGGMNDINGKEYKTGKAFHIYRPHIIDANGAETWGILHIENGIYSVEIPQDFLDTAVYPIKSNDTFGYGSIGGSTDNAARGANQRTLFTMGAVGGTLDKISTYVLSYTTVKVIKGDAGLYSSALALLGDSSTLITFVEDAAAQWYDFTMGGQSLTASTDYNLSFWFGGDAFDGTKRITRYYDAGTSGQSNVKFLGDPTGTMPDPFVNQTAQDRKYSIYATYTPAGGSAIKTINGLAVGSVKTINGLAIASMKTKNGLA